jgi:hypothetical protein
VSGAKTAERYCLIDMLMPTAEPAAASLRFRGDVHPAGRRTGVHLPRREQAVRAGATVNIPANAPHGFKSSSYAQHVRSGPQALRTGNEVQPSEQSCF